MTIKSGETESLNRAIYGYATEISGMEDENRLLKQTLEALKIELKKFKTPPFIICEVKDVINDKAVLSLKNGNEFYVDISEECKDLHAGDMVLAHQKNLTVIEKINTTKRFNVEQFVIIEKPDVSWKDIGGLKAEINEIQEVIELPLNHPELFREIGIKPPKGVLLYGPPGTGKTLLAKAVASSTNSTFIEIVGSELVQKFIGEGAKLVNEIFELARSKAPSIVFIDEIDALAAVRVDIGTSGEREVQRTFMQLLAELDGFNPLDNVKIIGATNRKDILDPAIIRPGRLDRLIKIGEPDKDGLKQIMKIHSKNMKLDKFNIDDILKKMEGMSGAEVRAVCTEAGYFAIREKRKTVTRKDFLGAVQKVKHEASTEGQDFMNMFR